MKGLTLIQPWGWCLFHGKPVENRTWAPAAKHVGKHLLIHAGLKYDASAAEWIRREIGLVVPGPKEIARGAIIGSVRLDRIVTSAAELEPAARPWFFGPVGLCLTDQVELEPFECRGALGLWDVPEAVLEQLRPLNPDQADAVAERLLQRGVL